MTCLNESNTFYDVLKLLTADGFNGLGEAVRRLINEAMRLERQAHMSANRLRQMIAMHWKPLLITLSAVSFQKKRMTYLQQSGSVNYRSKDGHTTKSFSALDWVALIISHIPRHGEQMVRYYGYYSNAAKGKRRKLGLIDETPEIASQDADTAYRKKCRANWARLIQKIYEIDPLTCPNCGGTMRVLAFIEDAAVIRKILDHRLLRNSQWNGCSPFI